MINESSGSNLILRRFIEARISKSEITNQFLASDFVHRLKDQNLLDKLRENVWISSYKTRFDGKVAVGLILYFTELPGTLTGSSSSSEIIMSVVKFVEDIISPVTDINCERFIENEKISAVVKIIKILDDEKDWENF